MLFLYGPCGFGKTQLSLQCAKFEGIYGEREKVFKDLSTENKYTGKTDKIIDEIAEVANQLNKPTIVIIDNVDLGDDLRKIVTNIPKNNNLYVIVTTIITPYDVDRNTYSIKSIKLDSIKDNAQVKKMFSSWLKIFRENALDPTEVGVNDSEEVKAFITSLGGIPHVITTAAGYFSRKGLTTSLKDWKDAITNTDTVLLGQVLGKEKDKQVVRYVKTIADVYIPMKENITSTCPELKTLVTDLLFFLAFQGDQQAIPWSVFDNDPVYLIDILKKHSNDPMFYALRYTGSNLTRILRDDLSSVVEIMEKYSIVDCKTHSSERNRIEFLQMPLHIRWSIEYHYLKTFQDEQIELNIRNKKYENDYPNFSFWDNIKNLSLRMLDPQEKKEVEQCALDEKRFQWLIGAVDYLNKQFEQNSNQNLTKIMLSSLAFIRYFIEKGNVSNLFKCKIMDRTNFIESIEEHVNTTQKVDFFSDDLQKDFNEIFQSVFKLYQADPNFFKSRESLKRLFVKLVFDKVTLQLNQIKDDQVFKELEEKLIHSAELNELGSRYKLGQLYFLKGVEESDKKKRKKLFQLSAKNLDEYEKKVSILEFSHTIISLAPWMVFLSIFKYDLPDNKGNFYELRGSLAEELGKLEDAARYYIKAIEVGTQLARIRLASLYRKAKKWNEAIQQYDELININPQCKYFIARGDIKNSARKFPEAVEDYCKAVNLVDNKESLETLTNKCLEIFLKQPTESIKALSEVQNPTFVTNLMIGLHNETRGDKAIKVFEVVHSNGSTMEKILKGKQQIDGIISSDYERKMQLAEITLSHLNDCLKQHSHSSELRFLRGCFYKKIGDIENAIKDFEVLSKVSESNVLQLVSKELSDCYHSKLEKFDYFNSGNFQSLFYTDILDILAFNETQKINLVKKISRIQHEL